MWLQNLIKVDVFVTKSKIDQNLDFEDLSDLPDMEELAQNVARWIYQNPGKKYRGQN